MGEIQRRPRALTRRVGRPHASARIRRHRRCRDLCTRRRPQGKLLPFLPFQRGIVTGRGRCLLGRATPRMVGRQRQCGRSRVSLESLIGAQIQAQHTYRQATGNVGGCMRQTSGSNRPTENSWYAREFKIFPASRRPLLPTSSQISQPRIRSPPPGQSSPSSREHSCSPDCTTIHHCWTGYGSRRADCWTPNRSPDAEIDTVDAAVPGIEAAAVRHTRLSPPTLCHLLDARQRRASNIAAPTRGGRRRDVGSGSGEHLLLQLLGGIDRRLIHRIECFGHDGVFSPSKLGVSANAGSTAIPTVSLAARSADEAKGLAMSCPI